jgi:hypothetical protein
MSSSWKSTHMARKPARGWWSDLDLPWWSLAAISVLTLLVATITG